jgi:hypothetical protein
MMIRGPFGGRRFGRAGGKPSDFVLMASRRGEWQLQRYQQAWAAVQPGLIFPLGVGRNPTGLIQTIKQD